MCTSTSMAGIGMGLQLGGGIGSAFSSQAYHNANASYLDAQNQINGIMTESAVDSIAKAAGQQASAARNKGISTAKSQRAAMASRGLSNSYTYGNLLDDSISRSEMDALAIQYNADVQTKNVRAQNMITSAQLTSQANAERTAGRIALISGLLSTGTQFAQSYAKWGQTSMGQTAGMTNDATSNYFNLNNALWTSSTGLRYGNNYNFATSLTSPGRWDLSYKGGW